MNFVFSHFLSQKELMYEHPVRLFLFSLLACLLLIIFLVMLLNFNDAKELMKFIYIKCNPINSILFAGMT